MPFLQNTNGGNRQTSVSSQEPVRLSAQEKIYQNVKNPYEQVVPSTQLSGFQRALDALGITNYAGKYAYQNQLSAAQWEAEQASRMADLEYNNPITQAQLQREAGLNPDLNGVQGYEASTSGNSMNVPTAQAVEVQEPLNKIAAGLFNALTTGLSIAQGIQQLDAGKIANSAAAIKTASDAVDEINKRRLDSAHIQDFTYSNAISSRKVRKAFDQLMSAYNYDTNFSQRQALESSSKYMKVEEDYAQLAASPFRNQNDFHVGDMVDAIREYNQMYMDLEKIQAKYHINDLSYRNKSRSFETEVDYTKASQKFQKAINERMEQYFETLIGKDNLWSQIALMSMFGSQTGAATPLSIGSSVAGGLLPLAGKFFKKAPSYVTNNNIFQ